MIGPDVFRQLQEFSADDDFVGRAYELTDFWMRLPDADQAVEPILRFMEENPSVDYGVPGPLVHFVERFHGRGYELKLIASIRRRPTQHTVWMLNRLINRTRAVDERQTLVEEMECAAINPAADHDARRDAREFLACVRS